MTVPWCRRCALLGGNQKPSCLGCPDSSELPGGKAKSAGSWRLWPFLYGLRPKEIWVLSLNLWLELLEFLQGSPIQWGRMSQGQAWRGTLAAVGHSQCVGLWGTRLGTKPSSLPCSSWGKAWPGAVEMDATLPLPRELSILGSCEFQCWLLKCHIFKPPDLVRTHYHKISKGKICPCDPITFHQAPPPTHGDYNVTWGLETQSQTISLYFQPSLQFTVTMSLGSSQRHMSRRYMSHLWVFPLK